MYVCVETSFVSMLGQFQVLMALLDMHCECCVVSVIVCVCVCVCPKPLCIPLRKSRWVFLCVSFVYVCRDTFVSMFGHFQMLIVPLETQRECCAVSVTVCVCVCVCLVVPHCVCL